MTSDLADWSVHGPVKTLQTEFAEWDLSKEEWGPPRNFRMVRFLPGGRINVSEHHNPDGSISRTTFHYDDASRLSETRFQIDDSPTHKIVYFYDASDGLARSAIMDENGTERELETYSVDAGGRRTAVHVLQKIERDRGSAVLLTSGTYGANGPATITTIYDEHEQPSETLLHDAGGQLLRHEVMTRDDEGTLLKEETFFAQNRFSQLEEVIENEASESRRVALAAFCKQLRPDMFTSITTYAYDEKGRRIERHTRSEFSEDLTTYRYDQHDNPIDETTARASRDLQVDEQGNLKNPTNERSHQQHIRFDYIYDARGNWTERVVWSLLEPNPEFQRSNVERRVITYT